MGSVLPSESILRTPWLLEKIVGPQTLISRIVEIDGDQG